MPKTPDLNIDRTIGELIASQRKPQLLPETGWAKVSLTIGYEASTPKGYFIGIGFTNSWINATQANSVPASWYLSDDGEVRLRGKIRGGNDDTVAFVLPEDVRPEYAETFVAPVDENGNVDLSGIKYRAWGEGDTES